MLIAWNGVKWAGNDILTSTPRHRAVRPGRLLCSRRGWDACLPSTSWQRGHSEHYEPMETPLGTNPLHPNVISSPVVRIYADDVLRLGKRTNSVCGNHLSPDGAFPPTKHARLNAIAQPEQFVEISAGESERIANGDRVTVSSKRGFIRAVAVVTRRLQTLNVNGQQVETVGIPLHWGFEGVAQKGYLANTLTPNVGDSNSQTPEYKAFLVNIEKA